MLFSGSIPSGTHLTWSGGITEGVADEAISPAITLTLEDSHGNVMDVSGVKATLRLSGNDRVLGKAVLSNGVATLTGLLPKTAGKYHLSAAAGRLRISDPFIVEGGPGVRMKLTGFGNYMLFEGDEWFDVKLFDRFGNLATSDNSVLFFKVGQLDGTLDDIGISADNPGIVVLPDGTQGVHFGNRSPGYADFDIQTFGGKTVAPGVATEATVSVILYDSNPAIRPITTHPWTVGS